jgi:outer membrane autotransporter protein
VGPQQLTDAIICWHGQTTTANGASPGGQGTWDAGGSHWVTADGATSGLYNPASFLIFAGSSGVVSVAGGSADGLPSRGGLQFAVDGYRVQGDDLALGNGITTIRVGDGTAAGAAMKATIAAALSGSGGLDKTDLGTLILTGANRYSGPTTVAHGALVVNGSLRSAVSVQSGARLGGTGTLGGLLVRRNATLAPGNSIGTLNVAGDVRFEAGSIYEVETNAAGQADRISATGSAALDGKVNVLADAGNYAPDTRYTILSAAGGRSGQFESVRSNLAFLDASLTYDPATVYLNLTRNDIGFGEIGGSVNQQAAGQGVDSLGKGHALWDATVAMSAAGARAAFDQLSGEIHAATQTALMKDSGLVRDAALDRLQAGACGAVGNSAALAVNGQEMTTDRTTACDGQQNASWVRALGHWGRTASDGNAAGLRQSTGGLLLGADAALDAHWRIGALGGFSETELRSERGSGRSSNTHLGVYAGGQWETLALRLGAAYTWHAISANRTAAFTGFAEHLKSGYHAGTAQAFGELGYAMERGGVRLEPFVNLAYVHLSSEGFTEHGGVAALTVKRGSTNTRFSTLGLHALGHVDLGRVQATLKGTLGWRHAFGETTPAARLALTGGAGFTVAGAPITRNAAVLDAGLDFAIGRNTTLGVSYNGQFGPDMNSNGVRANLQVRF